MLDDDGLPLDEVGAWAKDKHDRLRKYVDISRAAAENLSRAAAAQLISISIAVPAER